MDGFGVSKFLTNLGPVQLLGVEWNGKCEDVSRSCRPSYTTHGETRKDSHTRLSGVVVHVHRFRTSLGREKHAARMELASLPISHRLKPSFKLDCRCSEEEGVGDVFSRF